MARRDTQYRQLPARDCVRISNVFDALDEFCKTTSGGHVDLFLELLNVPDGYTNDREQLWLVRNRYRECVERKSCHNLKVHWTDPTKHVGKTPQWILDIGSFGKVDWYTGKVKDRVDAEIKSKNDLHKVMTQHPIIAKEVGKAQANLPSFNMDFAVRLFDHIRGCNTIDNDDKVKEITFARRRSIDIYMAARIVAQASRRVVAYAGNAHICGVHAILTHLGYKQVNLSVGKCMPQEVNEWFRTGQQIETPHQDEEFVLFGNTHLMTERIEGVHVVIHLANAARNVFLIGESHIVARVRDVKLEEHYGIHSDGFLVAGTVDGQKCMIKYFNLYAAVPNSTQVTPLYPAAVRCAAQYTHHDIKAGEPCALCDALDKYPHHDDIDDKPKKPMDAHVHLTMYPRPEYPLRHLFDAIEDNNNNRTSEERIREKLKVAAHVIHVLAMLPQVGDAGTNIFYGDILTSFWYTVVREKTKDSVQIGESHIEIRLADPSVLWNYIQPDMKRHVNVLTTVATRLARSIANHKFTAVVLALMCVASEPGITTLLNSLRLLPHQDPTVARAFVDANHNGATIAKRLMLCVKEEWVRLNNETIENYTFGIKLNNLLTQQRIRDDDGARRASV